MLGFFSPVLRQLRARCFSFGVSIYFLFSLLYFTVLICVCVCVCVCLRTHTCGSIFSETLCHLMDLQVPPFVEFSRQQYWNGLQIPPQGDLPNPRIEATSPMSPALAGRFYHCATWEALTLLNLAFI